MEKEIQQLTEKLEKLRRNLEVKNLRARRCHNFDKQAALLQRELKMFRSGTSEKICVKKIREMAEISLSVETKPKLNESSFSSDDSNVSVTTLLFNTNYEEFNICYLKKKKKALKLF